MDFRRQNVSQAAPGQNLGTQTFQNVEKSKGGSDDMKNS